MRTYSEEEIRSAWRKTGLSSFSDWWLEALLAGLNGKKDQVRELADDDTITVKEFREAWHRKYPALPHHCESVLQDIISRLEPEYPYASVWKDAGGIIWYRAMQGRWMRFGSEQKFPHDRPRRPLKRMEVQ